MTDELYHWISEAEATAQSFFEAILWLTKTPTEPLCALLTAYREAVIHAEILWHEAESMEGYNFADRATAIEARNQELRGGKIISEVT